MRLQKGRRDRRTVHRQEDAAVSAAKAAAWMTEHECLDVERTSKARGGFSMEREKIMERTQKETPNKELDDEWPESIFHHV